MKIILVAIDTKFIHTNLALRYLKANCRYETTLLEYTIKDTADTIFAGIMALKPDVVAFSAYLWNIRLVEKIAQKMKQKSDSKIVVGGPEVAYDPEHYLNQGMFDYLIAGEGEIAFDRLMVFLHGLIPLADVPNVIYQVDGKIHKNPIQTIQDLDSLKNPYHFPEDIPNLPHKIQYVELSRGCPFHCSYCLASLENQVRFFSLDRLKADLLYLMDHGAKTFKFLDRTFNLNPKMAFDIFQFIIDRHAFGTVFQFEITGDILPTELIHFINANAPKNLFRFEIGIQSTNTASNLAVDRRQNNDTLFSNIRLIQQAGIIDLHLDLIAGLPEEDLPRFAKTFDEVFSLRAKELQLGFLKMLRGTKIRRESDRYGYLFQAEPPYEIIESSPLSKGDLNEIHLAEEALETYWNKGFMADSLSKLLNSLPSAFAFFNRLGHFYQDQGYSFHRYQYSDLFERLAAFVIKFYPGSGEKVMGDLKKDYLESCNTKSKIWWNNDSVKYRKNAILRDYFLHDNAILIDDLYKYSVVTEYKNGYLIAVYQPKKKSILFHQKRQ